MAHQLVIRGGQVVDGLGGEPSPADVAIDDGTITAVGKVDAKGRRELDAEGLTVTPGFIDLHTSTRKSAGIHTSLQSPATASRRPSSATAASPLRPVDPKTANSSPA